MSSSPGPPSIPTPDTSSAAPPASVTTTTPSTTPITTPTTTSPGTGGDSTTTTPNAPVYPTTTTTRAPSPDSTTTGRATTTSVIYTSSVLTESSTSVYAASSTITSDGQVYTTQISVTTVLPPGSVVTGSGTSAHDTSASSSSNTGAIVGGVVGGIAVLGILGLLCYYLLNKKRRLKDEFDGNFDPLAVNKHSPHPSVGAAAATSNAAARPGGATLPQVRVDEDDGMGGRIARGAGGGGVISPYPFASPPSNPPQTSQYGQGLGVPPGAMMAVGAGVGAAATSAYNNERPQYQSHRRNASNLSSVSSGNQPASVTNNSSTPAGAYLGMPHESHAVGGVMAPGTYGYQGQPGQYGQYGQQYAGQAHLQPSLSHTNTTSSGGGGQGYNQAYNPYAPPIGRGPSPGPSVGRSDTMSQSQYTSSSAGGSGAVGAVGGRSAKEIEAFGGNRLSLAAGGGGMMGLAGGMPLPHVANPDEGQDRYPQQQQQQQGPGYFGPQPTYNPPSGTGPSAGSSSTTVQPITSSQSTKPGLITLAPSPSITSRPLVQHHDAGRVEVQENPETSNEIPPAYDSLPQDSRR